MKLNKVSMYSIFIIIIFTSFMVYSYNEKMDKQSDNLIQISKVNSINKTSGTSKEQLIKLIKEGIESGDDINIKITNEFSTEKILEIIKRTIINYGYGGYISNFQYSIDKESIHVIFNYNNNKSETISKFNAVNLKVKEIVAEIIKPEMSDFEKEKAIHDYVINNTQYDNDNYIKGTVPEDSYNAYGVFFNKVAVCEGYSEAIYRLLNESGIENIIITGTGGNVTHSWNLVKIEGGYYHLDATYDDPISSTGNMLSYEYFNLNDEEISKDHSWNREDYPSSANNKYIYSMIN